MKNWKDERYDLFWRVSIGVFVIFFGGAMLAGILSLIAAAHPNTASLLFCPKGSKAIVNPDPDQRDPNKFPVLCQDQSGDAFHSLSYSQRMALRRKYFSVPSYILVSVLVIGWLVRPLIQQRMAK